MDKTRKQFETWYKSTVSDWVKEIAVTRNDNGRYADGYVQKSWEAWKAASKVKINIENFESPKVPVIPAKNCCGCRKIYVLGSE